MNNMSVEPGPSFQELRRQMMVALLPDLILSVVAPVFIYRLAIPYMSAPLALLLAGMAPIIPIGSGLWRRRRLNPPGVLSLLTIAVKIVIALLFNDTRWMLASVSLITGAHGVIMLASLLTPRPLLLWLVENTLSRTPTGQALLRGLVKRAPRSSWVVVTAVWGTALLLECGINVALALALPVELFLVVSPIVRYGLLGGVLLGTMLFAWMRWRRKRKTLGETSSQSSRRISHIPILR